MAVESATEASNIVVQFLAKVGWSTFIAPRRAEKKDSVWIVEFTVGFREMQFQVDAETGQILRYETIS